MLLLFVLVSLLHLANGQSGYVQQGYSWTSQYEQGTQATPWLGRYGASAAVTSSGSFVLLGGIVLSNLSAPSSSSYTIFNDAQLSSSLGSTFAPSLQANFTPRFFHASALTSAGSIILIGGFTLSSATATASSISSLKDTWYSNDGVSWAQGSQMPWSRGRGGHDCDADLSALIFYVTCGFVTDPGQPSLILNDVWMTPDAGNTWQIATINAAFAPRAFHAALVRQGALFIVGGATWASGAGWSPTCDVWVSYDQGSTFSVQQSSTPLSFLSRFLQSAFSYNNDDLLFMCGVSVPANFNLLNPLQANSTLYSDVWQSTDAALSWQQTNPSSIFLPRFSSPVVVLGQDLLLLSGVNSSGQYQQDVWMTVLPIDSANSDGTVVAAVVGTLSGILMIVVVVMRRMQDRFAKGGGVVVSGKTEQEIAADNRKAETQSLT